MSGGGAARSAAIVEPERDGRVVVNVHVQPRAGRTEVIGRHGDALKIRVTAPPERGLATDAAAAALAAVLGLPKASVVLRSGATSRLKRFAVLGLDRPQIERRLAPVLGPTTTSSGDDRD